MDTNDQNTDQNPQPMGGDQTGIPTPGSGVTDEPQVPPEPSVPQSPVPGSTPDTQVPNSGGQDQELPPPPPVSQGPDGSQNPIG